MRQPRVLSCPGYISMQTPQQTASSKPEELASPKTKEIYSVAFLTNLHFLILIFFLLALFPTVLFPHHFPPSPIIRWHLWISIKSCFHASSSSPGFNCTPRSSVLHHRAWDSSMSLTALLVQQQFCLCPGTPLICVSIKDTVCKQLQVLLAPRFCI